MSRSAMSFAFPLVLLMSLAFSPTKAAAADFGAIAYNQETEASSYALNYRSRATAETQALDGCGPGCQVVLWFRNSCGALAIGDDGYGTGFGPSLARAEAASMATCARFQVHNCAIRHLICNGR